MKQYILLDWDGNLAQTLHIWLDACRIGLQNQGVTKSDEEIAASFGQFSHFMKEWGVPDIQKAIDDADIAARKLLPDVELYPDVLLVLETLKKQGKKLALITTSPLINLEQQLIKHALHDMFDAVITAEDTPVHKPNPEPLELGLKKIGGNKAEAVMIGDSDKDLGAAQNAGIDSILFYPAEHKKFYKLEDLHQHNPTHVVTSFKDIIELVNS